MTPIFIDCARLKIFLEELRDGGIADLRAYFTGHPDEFSKAAGLVKIVNVSDYVLRLFEAKSEDELLHSLNYIVLSESLPVFFNALIALAEGQCCFEAEAAVQTVSRKPLTCLFTFSFPVDADVPLGYFLVTITDITARKRAEDILRQKEEQYRKQFEEATDAIFLADTKTGIILDCNIAAGVLLEREKSEIIGMHQCFMHPTENIVSGFTRTFKRHVEGEAATLIEEKVVTKSGKLRDVAIKANKIILKDKEVLQGIFRDITEYKRAQETLALNEKRLLFAQQTAHIGNWEWDLKAGSLYWSGENYRIFGLDPDKVTPSVEAFLDTVDPSDIEFVKMSMEESVQGKKPFDIDFRIRRPDGQVRFVNSKAQVELGGDGKAVMFAGTVQDITERKLMEEAKKNLLVDISHSLKTPLAVIEMALNMSERGIKSNDPKRIKRGHSIAYENLSRLRKYIGRMLEAFTVDLREMPLEKNKKKVSLRKIISRIFQGIELTAKEKGLKLKMDIPVTADMVGAGKREVVIILENLIDNAVKFTRKGSISVVGRRKKDWIEIRVKDTGCGLGPHNKNKLFEMFFKGYTVVEGLGLGLFICKRLTDSLGGQIRIESKGLGKGAEVILSLPRGQN